MTETKKRWPWPAGALNGDRSPCVCGHYLGLHDGASPYKCWVAGCSCSDFVTTPADSRSPVETDALREVAFSGGRCGPLVNTHTTREQLIAQGVKPEAADELLAFRDKLRKQFVEGEPDAK